MKSFIKSFFEKFTKPSEVKRRNQKNIKTAVDSNEDKNYLLDNFYESLHSINFQIKHIVDGGSNHGNWTRKALEHFPDAYFTLIEPQNWMKDDIKDLLANNDKISFHGV